MDTYNFFVLLFGEYIRETVRYVSSATLLRFFFSQQNQGVLRINCFQQFGIVITRLPLTRPHKQ